ncbi:MAG: ubiquinone-binding protein [Gammaproteobacteria bacterium]|nr:ubiquinone-binding protein [Gammaproteobacteria bacterium]
MYTVQRSALVLHSAENMAMLVNDVDRYDEFLPWCGGSRVLSRGENEMTAIVTIAFKGIRKSFTTKNQMIGNEQTLMALVDGPFESLWGCWTYKPLEENASKIALDLKFDFSSPIVGRVIGPVFKSIADSMVASFCDRADQIYHKEKE